MLTDDVVVFMVIKILHLPQMFHEITVTMKNVKETTIKREGRAAEVVAWSGAVSTEHLVRVEL